MLKLLFSLLISTSFSYSECLEMYETHQSGGGIDVPEYVNALEGDIQHFGGLISLKTSFLSAVKENGHFKIDCQGDQKFSITSKFLINCSGLSSEDNLSSIEGFQKKYIYMDQNLS